MKYDMKYVGLSNPNSIIPGYNKQVDDAEACLKVCLAEPKCLVWNLKDNFRCELLTFFTEEKTADGYIAGGRNVCIGDV